MNRFYLILPVLALLLLSAPTYSHTLGYYGGVQIGKAHSSLSGISNSTITQDANTVINSSSGLAVNLGGVTGSISNPELAAITFGALSTNSTTRVPTARIFFGFQFYEQLAFEVGALSLGDLTSSYTSKSAITADGVLVVGGIPEPMPGSVVFNQLTRKSTYNQTALDLNFKAIWPLNNAFDLYAKVGLAYMKTTVKTDITLNTPSSIDGEPVSSGSLSLSTSTSHTSYRVYPAIGFGAAYSVTENCDVDLSIYRLASSNKNVPNVDMVYAGLLVHLGGMNASA